MNAAEHDVGAALAREPSDFVAAQRIAGMDADADDVARRQLRRRQRDPSVSSAMIGSPQS